MKWIALLISANCLACISHAQNTRPLPDPRALMQEVEAHQKQLDKVRENYTFTSSLKTEELDSKGSVKKTEGSESECFFAHSHLICRQVKKDGKPLDDKEEKKETERVTKLVEKAEKTPPGQPLEGQTVSVGKMLSLMDVSNERRIDFRGRATIVFDFSGRKDAKTSGLVEDASKKMKGTIWVDEADREVSHLEVRFMDNFKIAGGLLASIEKGSNFYFDQAKVNEELWLPTGGEAHVKARVLLFKGESEHSLEKDSNFQRFKVQTEQEKSVPVQ